MKAQKVSFKQPYVSIQFCCHRCVSIVCRVAVIAS